MQRGIVGSPLGLTLGFTLAALVGGCVADGQDGGILVLKNVLAEDGCKATAMDNEVGISHGSLDLLLPSGYLFIAQMKSRITALEGQEDQRTIITSGAKIDVTFPNSQLFSADELADLKASGLTHVKQLFSASLAPNGGIADVGFELIPAALTQAIANKADLTRPFRLETVATFTVEGDMSGQTVSSQAFSYPITIGNNVSVNVVGPCPLPKGSTAPRTGYACNPAQDGVIDCCSDPDDNHLVCPATVKTM